MLVLYVSGKLYFKLYVIYVPCFYLIAFEYLFKTRYKIHVLWSFVVEVTPVTEVGLQNKTQNKTETPARDNPRSFNTI